MAGLLHNPLIPLGLLIVPAVAWLLYRTPFGLRVRAVGEHPEAAATLGVSVARVRYVAVALSGALAALGGAYLALDQHQFTDGMSAGRGFIALAAMIFGRWDPDARGARVPVLRGGRDAADPAAGNAGDPVAVRANDSLRAHDHRAGRRGRPRRAARGAGQRVAFRVPTFLTKRLDALRSGDAGKLSVLMFTAFIDMVGALMIIPLLPFYAKRFGASDFAVMALVASFSAMQLVSAPLWGRVSDRYGRKPALLFGLGASMIAYIVFAYADSYWLLFASRVIQGAGGGTTGVIQAYVADSVAPKDRARGLGWLSAATNAGVVIGPAIASFSHNLGPHWPGMIAALLCALNILFAYRYLPESHDAKARLRTRGGRAPFDAVVRVAGRGHRTAVRAADLDVLGGDRRVLRCECADHPLSQPAFRRDRELDRLLLHVHGRAEHHLPAVSARPAPSTSSARCAPRDSARCRSDSGSRSFRSRRS